MLRCIFFLFVTLVTHISYSQIDPLFSTYQNNRLWHNPGYAGAEGKRAFSFVTRNQWQVSDNPLTFILSYDQQFKKLSKSSLGAVLMHDRIGPTAYSQAGLVYSYTIELTEKASIRVGTQVSVLNAKIKQQIYTVVDPNDPIFQQMSKGGDETKLDADLGAWLAIGKSYLGLSAKHIFEPVLLSMPTPRHYYITAGTQVELSSKITMLPSVMARITTGADAFDISNLFCYNNLFIVGGAFRWNSAPTHYKNANPFILLTGLNVSDKIQLLFSYDIPASNLGNSIEGNIKVKI